MLTYYLPCLHPSQPLANITAYRSMFTVAMAMQLPGSMTWDMDLPLSLPAQSLVLCVQQYQCSAFTSCWPSSFCAGLNSYSRSGCDSSFIWLTCTTERSDCLISLVLMRVSLNFISRLAARVLNRSEGNVFRCWKACS